MNNAFYRALLIGIIFCLTLTAEAQTILYKELELSAEPQKVLLLYSGAIDDFKLKELALYKFPVEQSAARNQNSKNSAQKYAVLSFIEQGIKADQILVVSKSDKLSIKITEHDLVDSSKLSQSGMADTDLSMLNSEIILEQTNLAQLRKKVAEISRLNRLVQAQNTVTSLESRLAELQQDRQALSALIQLVPGQQLSSRQVQIENQLVLDSRAIGQQFDRSGLHHSEALSQNKEAQLKAQIEEASKLNVEDLRRRLAELKKLAENGYGHSYEESNQHEELQDVKGSRDNPL